MPPFAIGLIVAMVCVLVAGISMTIGEILCARIRLKSRNVKALYIKD